MVAAALYKFLIEPASGPAQEVADEVAPRGPAPPAGQSPPLRQEHGGPGGGQPPAKPPGGITGGYSTRTAESSNAGTTSSTRTGIQLKGDTGLYKVTANVHIRTPNGADVVMPVTTYMRVGLPEAAARPPHRDPSGGLVPDLPVGVRVHEVLRRHLEQLCRRTELVPVGGLVQSEHGIGGTARSQSRPGQGHRVPARAVGRRFRDGGVATRLVDGLQHVGDDRPVDGGAHRQRCRHQRQGPREEPVR